MIDVTEAEESVAEVLRLDSKEQIEGEAAAVRRFFDGDNASMMGGWT